MRTVKELLLEAIESEGRLHSSLDNFRIMSRFEHLGEDSKNAINIIFIELSGFGMDTLIKRSRESEE